MSSNLDRKLKQALLEATERLELAERELSAALAELTVSDRADKRIASERLRKGMAEVLAARSGLAELAEPSE